MYYKYKLGNGLEIIAEDVPAVRSVAFGIWIRGGSRTERRAEQGIAHFIEHMMFRGTARRTGAQIAEELDEIGGQINAFTSKEHTCYYTVTLDEHLDTAMDVLADMFFNSRLDDEDIAKEKAIVLEEIDMCEDTPDDLVYEHLQQSVWAGSPLAHPILGFKETVCAFGRTALEAYISRCYRAEDVVISIAGNLGDISKLFAKVEMLFSDFGSMPRFAGEDSAVSPIGSKSTLYTPSIYMCIKPIEQLHILLGFPGFSESANERYTLAVLNTVLGSGMSSVLFQKVREELGLAYSIYSHSSGFSDTGLLYIYAGTSPENSPQALRAIIEQTGRIHNLSCECLQRAKKQIKSNLLLSLESTQSRMFSIGRSQLSLGDAAHTSEIFSAIDAVSIESLNDVAARVLNLSEMSLATVGPASKEQAKELEAIVNGYGLAS